MLEIILKRTKGKHGFYIHMVVTLGRYFGPYLWVNDKYIQFYIKSFTIPMDRMIVHRQTYFQCHPESEVVTQPAGVLGLAYLHFGYM